MEIRIHNNIFSIKKHWLNINPANYSSFGLWKLIWLLSPIYLFPCVSRLLFIEVLENNQPVLIIPLCKKIGKAYFFSFSRYNGTFKFDFVYNKNTSPEKLTQYLNFALKNIDADKIVLDKIVEGSLSHFALCHLEGIKFDEKSVKAVMIKNINEYESWYNLLSKNTRQNIRTAQNRLHSDKKTLQFEFYSGEKISRKQLNSIINMYCDRHIKRYDLKVSWLKRFYLKHIDFSTIFTQNSKNNFYAILKFDNRLAAFMSGIKEGTSFKVPRLSINETFGRYSPGVLLINETIKILSCSNEEKNLDLGIGDEKYKLQMGGTEYNMLHMEHVK